MASASSRRGKITLKIRRIDTNAADFLVHLRALDGGSHLAAGSWLGLPRKESNRVQTIKDGLLAIMHDRLYQVCTYYIQQGWIDASGLKNLEYLYQSYHALGGNGTGTELYNRAKALPIRD